MVNHSGTVMEWKSSHKGLQRAMVSPASSNQPDRGSNVWFLESAEVCGWRSANFSLDNAGSPTVEGWTGNVYIKDFVQEIGLAVLEGRNMKCLSPTYAESVGLAVKGRKLALVFSLCIFLMLFAGSALAQPCSAEA